MSTTHPRFSETSRRLAPIAAALLAACNPPLPAPLPAPSSVPARRVEPVAPSEANAPEPTLAVRSSYAPLGWFDGIGYFASRDPERGSAIVGVRLSADGARVEPVFRVPGSAGPLGGFFTRFGSRMVVAHGEGLLFYATPTTEGVALEGKRAAFSEDGARIVSFEGTKVMVYDGRTSARLRDVTVTTEIGVGTLIRGRFIGTGTGLCVVDIEHGRVLLDEATHAAGWSPQGRYAARLRQRPRAWRVADLMVWDLTTMKTVVDASVGAVIRGADTFSFVFFGAHEQQLAITRQGPNWREPTDVVAAVHLRRRTVQAPPTAATLAQVPLVHTAEASNGITEMFATAVASGRRFVNARSGPGQSNRTAARQGETAVLVSGRAGAPSDTTIVEPGVVVFDVAKNTVAKRFSFSDPGGSPALWVDILLAPTGRHFLLRMEGTEGRQAYVVDIESEERVMVKGPGTEEVAHVEWQFDDDGQVLFSHATVIALDSLRRFDLSDMAP